MCNPSMEAKVKELMELKRMKEELEAEIAAAEDAIKAVMGDGDRAAQRQGDQQQTGKQLLQFLQPPYCAPCWGYGWPMAGISAKSTILQKG